MLLVREKSKIQVKKSHYNSDYDQLPRWESYFVQIKLILETNPKYLLELGIGNGLVSSYLKNMGINVTSCDFDKKLNPDVVSDIRNLPFKENSFDCIAAYEILEHIPYESFDKILKDLKKISKKYLIISLPSPGFYFRTNIRFNGLKRMLSRETLSFGFNIPPFFKNKKFDGEHYWEIGWKNYPFRKIKKTISKYFIIRKKIKNPLAPLHTFFLLEIK